MTKVDHLRTAKAQLMADVRLYRTEDGGKSLTAHLGWGCTCMMSNTPPWTGWDAWPLLGNDPLNPGDERRLGFVFLSLEGLEAIRSARKFYLWEGRIIGEAEVIL